MTTIPIRLVSTESKLIAEFKIAADSVQLSELHDFSSIAANALGKSVITSHLANGVMTAWIA